MTTTMTTNSSKTRAAYIEISPRGFANETFVYRGTVEQVENALSIVNNNVSAWARRVPASSAIVRAAQKNEYNDDGESSTWLGNTPEGPGRVPALTEDAVRKFRPQLMDSDGRYSLGGGAL